MAAPLSVGAVNATEAVFGDAAVAVTPVGAEGAAIPVAGNTAVTVIDAASVFTALFVVVALSTVKKFAVMPLSVYPATGVIVIVAVSTVFAGNGVVEGFHVTAVVYCELVVDVIGVAPVTGVVIPAIAADALFIAFFV